MRRVSNEDLSGEVIRLWMASPFSISTIPIPLHDWRPLTIISVFVSEINQYKKHSILFIYLQ
jgi:hypothetical protein